MTSVVLLSSLITFNVSTELISEKSTPRSFIVASGDADLPPLLMFSDGTRVCSGEDWMKRKEEIRQLMINTFVGTFPEQVPAIIRTEVLEEYEMPDGSTRQQVKLTFATPNKESFNIWVWIPKGEGPFPLLLTQPYNKQIGWAEMALKRGYIVSLYPGLCPGLKSEEEYPGYEKAENAFRKEYPGATWTWSSTSGWLASRTLDYLLDSTYGYQVTRGQIGIIGHSRFAIQAMIAAAFDERITSVVARSAGPPASCPYRFTTKKNFAQSVSYPTRRRLDLQVYSGREHELPIDTHGWLALIAPRRCLIHTAQNDFVESTFAVERAYLEGRKVYDFLGHPENLRVQYREGGHNPITDEHRRMNIDWFDLSFGRGTARESDFPEEFIHRFNWQAWRTHQTEIDMKPSFTSIRISDDTDDLPARIQWMLGKKPDNVKWDSRYRFLTEQESKGKGYDRFRADNTARMAVCFGQNVRGNIYYNTKIKDPVAVVVWLHPYSYNTGYVENAEIQNTTIYHRLAQEGFVVLAYDQCGFGQRLLEGRDFYNRYPGWSRFGRMVHDVGSAMDFLIEGKGKSDGPMPEIRQDQIYVLGYSLGGMVGLYAAALDTRITGVASFSGFTPMRTDTDTGHTGGIRRLWEWHALLPKLGLYDSQEHAIPYDFDDVLKSIAPRHCLVVSPMHDRDARFNDVVACVNSACKSLEAKGIGDHLTHIKPDDINRFQTDQQNMFLNWITLKTD